jgi:phospholipid transport system substrate-binding protein
VRRPAIEGASSHKTLNITPDLKAIIVDMKGPGRAILVLLLTAFATLVVIVPSARSADVAPKDVIKQMAERMSATLKNKQMSFDEKKNELRSEVERRFDLDGMAQASLGEHWHELSEKEQAEFHKLFADVVRDAYLGRIQNYTAEQLQIIDQDLTHTTDLANVSGSLDGGDRPSLHLNFELKRMAGDWKISDYAFNADSAMRNYSSHLKWIFENEGIDTLMDYLRKQRARLDADLGASQPANSEAGK